MCYAVYLSTAKNPPVRKELDKEKQNYVKSTQLPSSELISYNFDLSCEEKVKKIAGIDDPQEEE